ncbi:MAG: NADH-quinone oxidoreductase subunit J [Planctomycetota bacterium]
MEAVVGNPFLLYLLFTLGAVGVFLAMPRERLRAEIIGLLLGSAAFGGVAVLLGYQGMVWSSEAFPWFRLPLDASGDQYVPTVLPNPYFYLFGLVALLGAVRMITHPRPVYAALHFILTIIATAGLVLLLAAEFMAFALIIIYAGAILITYLFVIMLATQAPTQEEPENLRSYDIRANAPVSSILVGFLMIGALSVLVAKGVPRLEPRNTTEYFTDPARRYTGGEVVRAIPQRLEKALRNEDIIQPEEIIARGEDGGLLIDGGERTAGVVVGDGDGDAIEGGVVRFVSWPDGFAPTNTESVGYNLIKGHPGAIEIAGVILLMAMLGAVVLARKQIQIDDEAKYEQARALGYAPARPGEAGGEGSDA